MRIFLLITVLLLASGFSFQPTDERKAQDAMPQAKDSVWKEFYQCKVSLDRKKFTFIITYTPEVRAMEGKPLTISGFMLPLEPTEKFKHFLLSKRTPTCPFCMPGKANEIIEIYSTKPMDWDENLITMTGTLTLVNDQEKGIFFQIKDAVKK